MNELDKLEINWRNPDGTLKEGHPPMGGRPKGKTMKEYAREYFMLKTDEEKREYIENLEKVKPGFAWTMGEGNPETKTDVTSGGLPLILPATLINKNDTTPDSGTSSTG